MSDMPRGAALRDLLREAGTGHYTGACLLSVDMVMRVIEHNQRLVAEFVRSIPTLEVRHMLQCRVVGCERCLAVARAATTTEVA